jgi:preprotein translocase subunit SecF
MSATSAVVEVESRRGFVAGFRRLYYGQTRFDFVRRRKIWFALSGLVILAGVVSMATRGLNFDIQFVGGTSWQVAANGATVTDVRNAITPYGLGGAPVTVLGSGKNETVQVEAKLGSHTSLTSASSTKIGNEISAALARVTHHSSVTAVTEQQVGPTWGSQITHKAIVALIVFFIMIALYISIFFEWKMALAAIIAVLHDIVVTVGIYSLSGFLVTPDTVVAFLTILGYSLYDTIVVFDRIRDNTKGLGASGKLTFTDVVNLSMNQTLARSINTSLVAIMPILAVLVLGADVLGATTLQYFGLALLIGLTSGAYSSIFIASPLVAVLKEREPRYTQIRARLEGRGAGAILLSPAAVAAGALGETGSATSSSGSRRRRRVEQQAEARARGPIRPGAASAARSVPDRNSALDGEDEELGETESFTQAEGNGRPQRAAAAAGASARAPSRGGGSAPARGTGQRQGPAPRPRKKRRR